MTLNRKDALAVKELIREKILEGQKASQIISESGLDSELVLEVMAEEKNKIRDKAIQDEKDEQQRSMNAKRERQYEAFLKSLGQEAGQVEQNGDATVSAPVVDSTATT